MNDTQVLAAIEAQRDAGLAAMRFVHEHPELAHEEHLCAEYLASTLERAGLEVARAIAGMPTAFTATLTGSRPGRSVGIAVLYDAVPAVRPDGSIEPVHSCGHGPISGGVTATALALASLRDELPGTLVVVGCPADEIHASATREIGSGKLLSAKAGVWDSLDAALYAHPEFNDTVSLESRWMRREHLRVFGTRSLVEGAAQPPLDAAHALLHAFGSFPPSDVMLERLELDGDVEEGAGLSLRATVLVFADDEASLDERAARVRAALPEAELRSSPTVCGIRPNPTVRAAVKDAFLAAGRDFLDNPAPLPFATDFGNVSRRVPAALIGIGHPGGWSFHTDEGARQFASPDAEETALVLARVVALSAVRLLEPQ